MTQMLVLKPTDCRSGLLRTPAPPSPGPVPRPGTVHTAPGRGQESPLSGCFKCFGQHAGAGKMTFLVEPFPSFPVDCVNLTPIVSQGEDQVSDSLSLRPDQEGGSAPSIAPAGSHSAQRFVSVCVCGGEVCIVQLWAHLRLHGRPDRHALRDSYLHAFSRSLNFILHTK